LALTQAEPSPSVAQLVADASQELVSPATPAVVEAIDGSHLHDVGSRPLCATYTPSQRRHLMPPRHHLAGEASDAPGASVDPDFNGKSCHGGIT